jgi:ABC-type iron transport system FetAB ATPase subunit
MLLKRAIESGNEEEVYSAIGALATQYTQFVNEIYGNFAQKMGVEDGGLVLPYTVRMFQDRTGLHSLDPEIFQTLFARMDEELRVAQELVMDLVGRGDADREAAMRDFQIASARVVFLEHMNPDQNRV